MTVLIVGGTGRIGSVLVPTLRERDVPVVVASRHVPGQPPLARRFDVRAGDGFLDLLYGMRSVVLLHTDPKNPDAVDRDGTLKLLAQAKAGGVMHVVLLSEIGIETMATPAALAKQTAELALSECGVGWTLLRSAPTHDRVADTARELAAGRWARVSPGWMEQPVDRRVLIGELARLAVGRPEGRVADLAGPQRVDMTALVRRIGGPQTRVRTWPSKAVDAARAAGGNLPGPSARLLGPGFDEWFETR